MPKPEIKTVIFDFGDTLVSDTTDHLERKYGLRRLSKAKQQRYMRAVYSSQVGKTTTAELLRVMHEILVPKMSPKQIESYLVHNKMFPTWGLAKRLARRYKVMILSNNQKNFPEKTSKALRVNFMQFPFINSARVGLRKPHLDIYRYTLRRYKLKPEETVFVDDKSENLTPAKKLGIHTFRYKNNYRELLKFFKKLGVSV